MSSISALPVPLSLPVKQTSAQKAIQQIPAQIRADREQALTELFCALRTWRVNPKTYTQDEISPALKDRISALNSSSTELQAILEVALKFARANEGKFTSNEALILAVEQELEGLEKSIESKKPRSSFCKLFFSTIKVAAVGIALLGTGLYASDQAINSRGASLPSASGPIGYRPANFSHLNGKPSFFKEDYYVDEDGANKIYCPFNARFSCFYYMGFTKITINYPTFDLPSNPYIQRAGGTIHQITFGGEPIPVAAGGELAAVRYMEELSQANPDSLGRPASNFTALRERIRSLWPDATESPLTGNY